MSGILSDSVVGPAPWYWKTFPGLGTRYEWRFVSRGRVGYPNGDAVLFELGATGQHDEAPSVLIVRRYGRVLRANDGHILLWGPRERKGDLLIETHSLATLTTTEDVAPVDNDVLWTVRSEPVERLSIPQGLPAGRAPGRYAAPAASTMSEILLLANGPSPQRAATSIYAWNPGDGTVDVMPQTWFRDETNDLGYEWITRVVRDPSTGHIFGDGIRIAPFELDADGALLRKAER
jgi:hypothetical protein